MCKGDSSIPVGQQSVQPTRRQILIGLLGGAALAGARWALADEVYPRDEYGGWRKLKGRKNGFFHAEKIKGRWWLVTPEGNAFLSKGVCHVSLEQEGGTDTAVNLGPEGRLQWAKATSRQLRDWNFNTIGAWSDADIYRSGIAYTLVVEVGETALREVGPKTPLPDYFGDEFRQVAERQAQRSCAQRADDPWLLGYFTDNELPWTHNVISWSPNPPWNLEQSLLETYLKLPEESPGRQRANEYLKTTGLIQGALTEDDMNGFAEIVAAQYARVCRDAVRKHDPNHMILGCRFAGHAPVPILRGTAPYFDVVSFNNYHPRPPLPKLQQMADVTGKPVMITEFSFKAMDSGLPNTRGAGEPVATQRNRADGFSAYVRDLASVPACVGFHWFQYRDEPSEGRTEDGENSNYGLVKADGSPWVVLTDRMREVNACLEELAARSLPKPRGPGGAVASETRELGEL